MADFKKLRKKMEKELHAKRYEHTLSVAYTAASLAMVHNVDTDSAMTAGLLHLSLPEKRSARFGSRTAEPCGASSCKGRQFSCPQKIWRYR